MVMLMMAWCLTASLGPEPPSPASLLGIGEITGKSFSSRQSRASPSWRKSTSNYGNRDFHLSEQCWHTRMRKEVWKMFSIVFEKLSGFTTSSKKHTAETKMNKNLLNLFQKLDIVLLHEAYFRRCRRHTELWECYKFSQLFHLFFPRHFAVGL